VVAEGIEDEDQRSMLSRLGCSYGQGFLLGRPGRIDLVAVS
jgi:EAL domain-containing protein (putative c-di-GMP-specific phosphodiesterase class I)